MVAIVTIMAAALVGGPAIATSPSNVVLATGIASQPNRVDLIAADTSAIVYSVADPQATAEPVLYVRPTIGATTALPVSFESLPPPTIVGAMIGAFDKQTFTYCTVDGSLNGTAAVTAGTFQGTSADGYLYSAVPTGATVVHLYDVNVATRAITDLGAVPDNPTYFTTVASSTGVLLQVRSTAIPATQTFVPSSFFYVSYTEPHQFTELGSGIPVVGAPALSSDAAEWLQNPTSDTNDGARYQPTATTLVRVALDGSPGESVAAPNAVAVAMTPSLSGITTETTALGGQQAAGSFHFSTIPAAGGIVTTYPTPVLGNVISAGSAFVVDEGDTSNVGDEENTAGLYSLTSAAGPATQLVTAGRAVLRANSIAISPGLAVWDDNGSSTRTAGVWSRGLRVAGSALTATTPSIVTAADDDSSLAGPLASSGVRVAYIDNNNTLWLKDSESAPEALGTASSDDGLTLSGTRLLQDHDDGSATLTDLAHSTSVTLAAPTSPWAGAFFGHTPYQLWGNELAWLSSNGAIWFKNLNTNAIKQISGPIVGAGHTVLGSVAVAGDTVAWSESTCTPAGISTRCGKAKLLYRNARTLGPIYSVPADSPTHIQLSSGYLAFDDDDTASGIWLAEVNSLYTTTIHRIAPVPNDGVEGSYFSLSGSLFGWIGTDHLPHVQALPRLTAPAWYLGNGIAPASLVADGVNSWDGDFPTSAALTSCAVAITSGSTASGPTKVRTLPCAADQARLGEAAISWDGENSKGQLVPPGTYTWTLTGKNANGPLLNADGSDSQITGTITTTSHSAIELAATNSTGRAHDPVTFTATLAATLTATLAATSASSAPASSAPAKSSARNIEFFDGNTLLGTSQAIGDVATLTTSKLGPGVHSVTATSTATGQTAPEISAPVGVTLSPAITSADNQTVDADVTPGTLTITTPYTSANPLDLGVLQLDPSGTKLAASAAFGSTTDPTGAIDITDTRAGNSNWTVSVQASDLNGQHNDATINGQNTGLTALNTIPIAGNALTSSDIILTDISAPALPLPAGIGGNSGLGGVPHIIATTTNGGDGSIGIDGTFTLDAPTSTIPGVYEGTIVFTVG